MTKKKIVLTNIDELRKIVATVSPERKSIVDSLFNEIVFMQGTLVILREQI